MKNLVRTTIVCLSAAATALAADRNVDKSSPWPAWRGPLASGVAPNADPPVEWSEDLNIRWKVKIPGSGNASPIIWGDLVFIQTAVKTDTVVESDDDKSTDVESNDPPAGRSPHGDRDGRADRAGRRGRGMWQREKPTHLHKFIVMALDRKTGKTVWQRTVREELPHESGHGDTTHAACSPVVDGQHIYAYFGSRGLYCLDMHGEVIWEKDFGDTRTRNQFGDGASPVLYKDTIVVNWDHEDQSFIVALDKNTGDERWRVDRDEVTSWATPL
ncbi:MAG: PQQ-like beta-propeller repeat protein, partial [Planctomycetes bacterium]|nr:PQQ-like beta-propeller repeat protein [Planctomycetota bacterium]